MTPSSNKRGFTLIEIMVSVAIFTVVMVISLGALLSISSADRKAETLKSVMNNLNFALESMARSIRTGVDYHCGTGGSGPQDCPSGDDYISFTAVDGNNVAYCLSGGVIRRQITGGVLSTDCASAVFLDLTAEEVEISNLTFYVTGAPLYSSGDRVQPKVTITISGTVPVSATQDSDFHLQTSVTQRLYDQ